MILIAMLPGNPQNLQRLFIPVALTGLLGLAACVHHSHDSKPAVAGQLTKGKAIVTSVKGQAEYAENVPPQGGGWKALFDGKTLAGWKATEFGGAGEVRVQNGQLTLHSGAMLTGVNWTNQLPKTNYELALEAMKVDGADFFCGLTFPVGDSHCSFIVGGWGGGVVGISSLDGMDASENETTKFMSFERGRWYRIRVRVTPIKIEAWIDDEKLVDQSIEGRRVSMRPGEIELSEPFGIATYQTTGALRNIRMRWLDLK